MAQHEVKVFLPSIEIGSTDLEIEIRSDAAKLGSLLISKGTIDYKPNNHLYSISLTWEQFDEIMRGQV